MCDDGACSPGAFYVGTWPKIDVKAVTNESRARGFDKLNCDICPDRPRGYWPSYWYLSSLIDKFKVEMPTLRSFAFSIAGLPIYGRNYNN